MSRFVSVVTLAFALVAWIPSLPGCSSGTGGQDAAMDAPVEAVSDVAFEAEDAAEAEATVEDVAPEEAAEEAAPDAIPDATPDAELPPPVDPAIKMRAAGWVSGDLHMHSDADGGEDPVRVVVAIAEYLQSPEFLAFHPEYVGNPLDFIALTDHRTVEKNTDPDFKSDKVVLIPGEEFGGPGHAGIWGLQTVVSHDPGGDGSDLQDYRDAVDAAHAQGALFSPNHPMNPGITFGWDVRTHDSMEVWNTRWGLQGKGITPDDVAAWEAGHGATASPFLRRAAQVQGEGGSGQFLRFYEAQLSLGVHVALVGGSDRHLIFPEGFPSTWVKAATRDVAGILDGIRKRHTFVTRTPASATVELSVEIGGTEYLMGDQVPVPAAGAEAKVTVRVGRADKGRVRLIRGSRAADDDALATHPLGAIAFEAVVDGIDFETTKTLTLKPGDWLYPLVHETLVPEGLDPALAAKIPEKAKALGAYTEDNYSPLIDAMMDYMDPMMLLNPDQCDPAAWVPTMLQCMRADDSGMASFFFPDWIDRLFNIVTEDGEISDWTMGAVGSAVVCVEVNGR